MIRTPKLKEVTGGMPAGMHVATIAEVTRITSSDKDKPWSDTTDQLKVVFKNATGQITAWMNLEGFKNKSDQPDGIAPKGFSFASYDDNSEKFLIKNATKTRVRSTERTEKLLENIDNLAFCAGIEDEFDIDSDEFGPSLLGAEVGICVKENNRGKNEVSYVCLASKVSVEVED